MLAMNTLFLIDGSNLLFRAYHALPPMHTSKGHPTWAIMGLCNMMLRLEKTHQPKHVVAVFDGGGESPRAALFEQYKAHRPPCPQDLRQQIDGIQEILKKLGYTVMNAVDTEADDVIATLTKRATRAGMQVVIVSSDKDLMQLCSDQVVVLETMKNNGQGMTYGPKEVSERFGVSPTQLGDVLALMGDASDNIPGVPGIGAKTATQLIQQFGSLDALLAHPEEIQYRGAERIKKALAEHKDQLLLSRQLVLLDDDVPLPEDGSHFEKNPPDIQGLRTLLEHYELRSLLSRLAPATAVPDRNLPLGFSFEHTPSSETTQEQRNTSWMPPFSTVVHTLNRSQDLVAWLDEKANDPSVVFGVSFQLCGTEGSPNPRTTPLCGIGISAWTHAASTHPFSSIYLPIKHLYLGAPPQWETHIWVEGLKSFWENPSIQKSVQDAKQTHLLLQSVGIQPKGILSDPSLCSYLADPSQKHDLSSLIKRHAPKQEGVFPSREQLCKQGKIHTPLETCRVEDVALLAGIESQAVAWLGVHLRAALPVDSKNILAQMELPLASVLAQMEHRGILLNVPVLQKIDGELQALLHTIESRIREAAGYDVNIQSPKQLQELLFSKLQLTPTKKVKTGFSTDSEVLEALAAQHPIARDIHTHRSLAKLKNTYVEQLPKMLDPHSHRLHTCYHQLAAATGRLSSSDPNLQSIPIRTDWGTRIRQAFVAAPGHVLICADYSQIELRILAHLSGDPLLIESFRSGEDIHERTAVDMFGEMEGRKPEMRRVAKMINYGIMYGLSEHGLATRLSIPRSVAKEYMTRYMKKNQGMHLFMQELVDRARKEGGAHTLLGRFRPLPDLNTGSHQARSQAERMAKNTPLQGTAADLLKKAMILVQEQLNQQPQLNTHMLLTVHDELVLESPIEHKDEVAIQLRRNMEQALTLRVPLVVDIGMGATWADCK